jgi:hypothetical protein
VEQSSAKRETAILLAGQQAVKRLDETPKELFISAGETPSLGE